MSTPTQTEPHAFISISVPEKQACIDDILFRVSHQSRETRNASTCLDRSPSVSLPRVVLILLFSIPPKNVQM